MKQTVRYNDHLSRYVDLIPLSININNTFYGLWKYLLPQITHLFSSPTELHRNISSRVTNANHHNFLVVKLVGDSVVVTVYHLQW